MSLLGWILVGVGVWLLALLFVVALVRVAAPSSPFEQAREDREQQQYIQDYMDRKKHA